MTASLAANGASQEYHAEEAMDISIQQCKNHQNKIIVQRNNILQVAVPNQDNYHANATIMPEIFWSQRMELRKPNQEYLAKEILLQLAVPQQRLLILSHANNKKAYTPEYFWRSERNYGKQPTHHHSTK